MSAFLILRRLRALRRRDDGITLTELIVSMALFSIVGAMTLGLFLSINKSTAATTDRTVSSDDARNTLLAWTAYLRVADGTTAGSISNRIEYLTNSDMLFYADLNNRSIDTPATTSPPTMIWLRLDTAGNLIEEQFSSTAASGATPRLCRTLLSHVSTPAQPLFTAYDLNGNTVAPQGTAPTPSAGCVHLPLTVNSQLTHPNTAIQTTLASVHKIQIDFVVRDTSGAHPLAFTSEAVLPALGGQ